MPNSFDFKKEYKDLYLPKEKPMLIEVPALNFIMVDGTGDPNGKTYQQALEVLYALSYTIRMSIKSGSEPEGFFEYVMPPLEGLWWVKDESFSFTERDNWLWTSLIRQPEFVNAAVFEWTVEECRRKKPGLNTGIAYFESFNEGLCVQIMHIGPYADEPRSIELMKAFMHEKRLIDQTGGERKHHEIYLSDPRKTAPDKLRTVIRHPVAHA